jgi:hypothetical protein
MQVAKGFHLFLKDGIPDYQLQQYSITGKGKQTVTINGNSYEPGMYLYALVIDGKEVDTKRMILTK